MGRYRFVDPTPTRIEISDGDWVAIPKELSIEDDIKFGRAKSENDLVGMLCVMVLDWSFMDQSGKEKMPIGPDTIKHLDTETALEVSSAIAKHYSSAKDQKKQSRRSSSEKRSLSSAG